MKPTNKANLDVILQPRAAEERRWWFPAGSIVQVDDGPYRWESVSMEEGDPETLWVISGPLTVEGTIGTIGELGSQRVVDADLTQEWFDTLPEFPHCHVFHDPSLEGVDGWGPWYCMHGIYRSELDTLQRECKEIGENEECK